jgi:hypothetical protein
VLEGGDGDKVADITSVCITDSIEVYPPHLICVIFSVVNFGSITGDKKNSLSSPKPIWEYRFEPQARMSLLEVRTRVCWRPRATETTLCPERMGRETLEGISRSF